MAHSPEHLNLPDDDCHTSPCPPQCPPCADPPCGLTGCNPDSCGYPYCLPEARDGDTYCCGTPNLCGGPHAECYHQDGGAGDRPDDARPVPDQR